MSHSEPIASGTFLQERCRKPVLGVCVCVREWGRGGGGCERERGGVREREGVYQTPSTALVYDILPSTTAVFSYAIGSRKLSANEQYFVGAQTVVRLLQTTQIKQVVSFIAANKVYTSANKTTIF